MHPLEGHPAPIHPLRYGAMSSYAAHPGPRRILVVDDDADMRLYLRSCLLSYGLRDIIEASDGQEALALARALEPELVICDLLLPGLDGHALCRAMKADPALAGIPFVLISGETRAPPSCADGFLDKPFNAARLRLYLQRVYAPLR
ncbi:MAG: response regulator [Caldilineae bacterium]|nr:MAG: response regulator [Caldilineae bacterium]